MPATNRSQKHKALIACKKALQTTEEIIVQLRKANKWALFDLIGGGFFSDIIKYKHVSSCHDLCLRLKIELSQLANELEHASPISFEQPSVNRILSIADFVLDDLFVDWTVKSHIRNTLSQFEEMESQLLQLRFKLEKT